MRLDGIRHQSTQADFVPRDGLQQRLRGNNSAQQLLVRRQRNHDTPGTQNATDFPHAECVEVADPNLALVASAEGEIDQDHVDALVRQRELGSQVRPGKGHAPGTARLSAAARGCGELGRLDIKADARAARIAKRGFDEQPPCAHAGVENPRSVSGHARKPCQSPPHNAAQRAPGEECALAHARAAESISVGERQLQHHLRLVPVQCNIHIPLPQVHTPPQPFAHQPAQHLLHQQRSNATAARALACAVDRGMCGQRW